MQRRFAVDRHIGLDAPIPGGLGVEDDLGCVRRVNAREIEIGVAAPETAGPRFGQNALHIELCEVV
jgi:hypothetical protein